MSVYLYSNRKGFSLLEVIVASALFVSIFIILVQIFPFQKRTIVSSEKSTIATQLAQGDLENYSAMGFSVLKSNIDTLGSSGKFTAPTEVVTENNFSFTKDAEVSYVNSDLSYAGTATKLIKVIVTVKFTQNAQEQKVELTKVVYDI